MASNLILILVLVIIMVNFGFNMTEELNKETALLQVCILYQLPTKECAAIYGGLW